MNAITEEEVTLQPEDQTPESELESEQQALLQPEPVPPLPIRPLAETKAELERAWGRYKAFTERLSLDQKRLEGAAKEEKEILDSGDSMAEGEQLERLTKTLALQKVLQRKLERGQESGGPAVSAELEAAANAALRSLQSELADLRAKRETAHLRNLKRWVGEEQWPLAVSYARALSLHFSDIRPLDALANSPADYALRRGAIEPGAQQVLVDIASLEKEMAAKR